MNTSRAHLPPRLDGESDRRYHTRLEDAALAANNIIVAKKWDHKHEGTAQTHEYASRQSQGSLARLHMAGHINADQLEWACQIGRVVEAIERDVAVKTADYEMKVDNSGGPHMALVEGVLRVRMEVAYSWWRQRIPKPYRAVLDMLTGEPTAPSTIARRYRMGKKRARYILIKAIDLWPEAMDYAEAMVDKDDILAAHARLA